MFDDRRDAGRQLAAALEDYRGRDPIVMAIPRGGVAVGWEVARHLACDFDILVSRKLPFPDNPETGFGAIAEDGSRYLIPDAEHFISPRLIEELSATQKQVIRQRIEALRGGRPLADLAGRTVILVDDGIAMGSTMIAAARCCDHQQAGGIAIAAPVAGPRSAGEMRRYADDVVILETPPRFRAVAEAYRRWHDVSDAEVHEVLGEPR